MTVGLNKGYYCDLRYTKQAESMAVKTTFKEKYGPWALIAGGSQGIGEEFARQLASMGINLLIIGSY